MKNTVLLLVSVVLIAAACRPAGDGTASSEPELLRPSYVSSATGEEREYFVYLPRGFRDDEDAQWPVILFLHGGGERGNGLDELELVLMHGPLYEAWIQKRDLPFVMISPQLPMFGMGQYFTDRDVQAPRRLQEGVPPRPSEERPEGPFLRNAEPAEPRFPPGGPPEGWWMVEDDLLAMVDTAIAEYRGDPDRVYLTGLSYGGYGTFHMAAAHPERWAAIAPIAGGGDPATATALAEHQLPTWAFAGGRDDVVQIGWILPMIEAMNRSGHETVRFTVDEHAGHLVWIRVYAGQDLYDWFLEHER